MGSALSDVTRHATPGIYAKCQEPDRWIQPPAFRTLFVDFGRMRPAGESVVFVVPDEPSSLESVREEVSGWQQLAVASFFAFEGSLPKE